MSNDGVVAVERALSILDCFQPGAERLSLADLSARLPLHKTTIFRMLNSLVRCGYAIRHKDGTYTPGPRLLYLGRVYERSFHLSELVMPVLEALSKKTGESAAYYVEGEELGSRLCLFRCQPHEGLHSQVIAGSVMPPDNSSTARVFKTWAQLEPTNEQTLPYYSCGQRDPHTSSWSVPVIGYENLFVGALTIAGPTVRLNRVDVTFFERTLLQAADELASKLGATADIREALYQ